MFIEIKNVHKRNYTLDSKNPYKPEGDRQREPEEIIASIEEKEREIFAALEKVKEEMR